MCTRCEYCDWNGIPEMSASASDFGKGVVKYYRDIDRYLCEECSTRSFELADQARDQLEREKKLSLLISTEDFNDEAIYAAQGIRSTRTEGDFE